MSDDGNSSNGTNLSAKSARAAVGKLKVTQGLGGLGTSKASRASTRGKSHLSPASQKTSVGVHGLGSTAEDPLLDGLETMMSQLVNTSKMDSAWQKLSRRIAFLEEKAANDEEIKLKLQREDPYVSREEFEQFVWEMRKPPTPDEEELTIEKLSNWIEAERYERKSLQLDVQTQAQQTQLLASETKKASSQADNVKKSLELRLQESIKEVSEENDRRMDERVAEEASIKELISHAEKETEQLEKNLREFAQQEAERATRQLLFGSGLATGASQLGAASAALATGQEDNPASPRASAEAAAAARSAFTEASKVGAKGTCNSPAQWRAGLLQIVEDGLLHPFRHEVTSFKKEFKRYQDELARHFKLMESKFPDINKKIDKNKEDLKQESLDRAQDAAKDAEEFQKVYAAITAAERKASKMDATAWAKIKDLDEIVEKHSSKLAGHTKDILNSATVGDAKRLTDEVNAKTHKDIFKKTVDDMKQIVDYQGEKLEGLGMQVSVLTSAGGSKSMQRGKNKKSLKVPKNMKRDASQVSAAASTAPSAQASLQSLIEDSEVGDISPRNSSTSRAGSHPESAVGDPEDQEGFDEAYADAVPSSRSVVLSASRDKAVKGPGSERHEEDDVEEEEEDDGEEFEEESEEEEGPTEVQLREQVKGICMGLVCLGQHVLRGPPQCGFSRQNRLLNEKELLVELLNLRQWVTQRYTPVDWSLDKLTSVSLRYAHPNPAEVHGPQPEVAHALQRAAHSGGPFFTASSPKEDGSSGYGYSSGREKSPDRSKSPTSREKSPGRQLQPLNPSVGSIGIAGPCGANPGGGAGIMGGTFRDTTEIMATTINLPFLHGGKAAGMRNTDKVPFPHARPAKKAPEKAPMSAREPRDRSSLALTGTLPPMQLLPLQPLQPST